MVIASNAFIIREMEEKAYKEAYERETIRIAKNLLDILDDETIAKATKLSIEEVKELREETGIVLVK